ncbi:flagellar motor switch protein FliN/FliY [Alteribacillus persepolensis]|uniref:Flagellar motor switch protein FliN/FliY n=1 Tax=Alteribacillus persepolensis TaxID=568899 RepID=A0A1G7YPN1_9BACI|nr:flagellar motor switch phosphatase FliY [Alteribacillus persepolensis]SDG98169.1 flagellar motor switch protein FliN/FliY [Alteribacillus persepolensis]
MNDDMLSQEEINELLKSIGGDDEQKGPDNAKEQAAGAPLSSQPSLNIEDYLDEIEQDALGEIGNISFGSAATALSQLLNQKVDITTPVVSLISQGELDKEFPKPHVAVHVQYTDGFEGTNLLVIRTTDAAIIADLMLGGDGVNPSEELSDMHISAVQEAMNQMMGSASTSMSTIFNKRVDISPPGIDLLDVKESRGTGNIPEADMLAKISFRLKVGNLIDSSIMQLVTIPFAKQMVHDLMYAPEEKEQQPVQKQEEAPAADGAALGEPAAKQAKHEPSNTYPPASSSPRPSSDNQVLGREQPDGERAKNVQAAQFSSFEEPSLNETESKNLNMLLDIPLSVTVELGRTKRSVQDILQLSQGSIIELDKLAGEPVDILVNQKLVAKGEVVVIDENFGVRVTDIVSQAERIKRLK